MDTHGSSMNTLLIHIPIALLVIGVGFDLYGTNRANAFYQRTALALLILGLLGGLAAALVGFRTSDTGAALHQLWAIATLVIFGGLLLLHLAARTQWSSHIKGMYLSLAIAGAIVLAMTGFYGTELISTFRQ